jgi:hypothetical protein
LLYWLVGGQLVVLVEVAEVLELIYIALKVRRVDEVVKGVRESLKGL